MRPPKGERVRIHGKMPAEPDRGAVRFVFVTLTALALSACGRLVVEATRPLSASTVATIEPSGGTLQFPLADGYGGSFVYSSNDAPVATTAELTTTTAAVPNRPGPPPPGTILASFEFQLTNSVRFSKWNSLLTTIRLPSTVADGRPCVRGVRLRFDGADAARLEPRCH
jgi:hypothetical protein